MNPLLVKLLYGALVATVTTLTTLYFSNKNREDTRQRQTQIIAVRRPVDSECRSRQCGICSRKMDYSLTLECGHEFHKQCLQLVFSEELKGKRNCPERLCRASISEEIVTEILLS